MLHWWNLHWNGPASFSVVVDGGADEPTVTLSAFTRAVADILGEGDTELSATILLGAFVDVTATTEVQVGMKQRGRVVLDVDIAARPSAEDIAQAVWGAAQTITEEAGTMARAMRLMTAIAANRVVTDPVAGTYTVYDDDNSTVLASGDLWQDPAGTIRYSGAGAERRDRLT